MEKNPALIMTPENTTVETQTSASRIVRTDAVAMTGAEAPVRITVLIPDKLAMKEHAPVRECANLKPANSSQNNAEHGPTVAMVRSGAVLARTAQHAVPKACARMPIAVRFPVSD